MCPCLFLRVYLMSSFQYYHIFYGILATLFAFSTMLNCNFFLK